MKDTDLSLPPRDTLPGRFGRLVAQPLRAFDAWDDARRARKSLRGLSLHELADIGLSPADLDEIAARQPYLR